MAFAAGPRSGSSRYNIIIFIMVFTSESEPTDFIKDTQAGSGPVRISRVSPKMGERRDFSLTQARLSCSVCHETRAQLGITFSLLEPHFLLRFRSVGHQTN